MAALLAEPLQPSLDSMALRSILVPHDNKPHPRFPPSSKFPYDALLQVLFAFVFDASKLQTGKQPAKEHVQKVGH